jgi:hypothetical protein
MSNLISSGSTEGVREMLEVLALAYDTQTERIATLEQAIESWKAEEIVNAQNVAALEQSEDTAQGNLNFALEWAKREQAEVERLRAAIAEVRNGLRFHFDTCTDLGCDWCSWYNVLDRALAEGE